MIITIDGTNVSGRYHPDELAQIKVMLQAFDGEIGQGMLPQPDPTMANEWQAGWQAKIEAAAGVTLVDGFVGEQHRTRPGTDAIRRVDSITLQDDNALLYGFRAHDWSRPAETDRARVLAFASAFLPAGIDTTWVLNTNTATLAAKKYDTTSLFTELLQDVRDATSKTIYIEGRRLHSHLVSEGQTPAFAINDTAWDMTGTWFPLPGATRTKDPAQLINDVLARNSGGATATATDSGSISVHDAAGLKHQTMLDFPTAAAGDLAALAAKAVAESKDERITFSISVGPFTAAQTALVIPGSLIVVTCGEVGLSASTQRIADVTWRIVWAPDGRMFWADLELGYPLRIRKATRVEPPPVDQTAPPPATTDTNVDGACSVVVGSPATVGYIGAFELAKWGTGAMSADSTGLGHNGCNIGDTRWYGGPTSAAYYYPITITCQGTGALVLRWAQTNTLEDRLGQGPVDDFGYYAYLWSKVPTALDGGILLGSFRTGAITLDIPAYLLPASGTVYLMYSPISRVFQGPICINNFGTPIKDQRGSAYGYDEGTYAAHWMTLDTGQTAMADWLPVEEGPDGARVSFTLMGWDGTGTPQVTVNGLPATVVATDTTAFTVTLAAPPPKGSLVLARYSVAT